VLNVETVIVCGHVGHVSHVHCFPLNKAKASSLITLWMVRPKGFHVDNLCRQSWLRRCPRPINDPQLVLVYSVRSKVGNKRFQTMRFVDLSWIKDYWSHSINTGFKGWRRVFVF